MGEYRSVMERTVTLEDCTMTDTTYAVYCDQCGATTTANQLGQADHRDAGGCDHYWQPVAISIDVDVLWQGEDGYGDTTAHLAGCADVDRAARRVPRLNHEIIRGVTGYRNLVERMAASNVGSLESALREVGSYNALWHPEIKPCLRRVARAAFAPEFDQ